MTNMIPHDFHRIYDIYPQTIFRQMFSNTFHKLNDDVVNNIYDFLVPSTIDMSKLIEVIYEKKENISNKQYYYGYPAIRLSLYDFTLQFMKIIILKFTMKDDDMVIIPRLNTDHLFFRNNHFMDNTFSINYDFIEYHKLFWFKLFIEVFQDFHEESKYFCINMKYLKYFGIAAIILGFLFSMAYYIQTNSRSAITYETTTLSKQTIEEKIVATGSVVPEDEVNIVPQISGIIDEIFVEEGDEVVAGDLLAKIKVVPNEQSLNSAEGRVKTSRIILNNSTKEYNRNKKLFDKGVISEQDFNSVELRYNQDQQNLENALSDLQIIRLGSVGGSALTNTNVRSTVSGTVLQVPVKEGDQAIEANTFNPGTTIATVADLNKMIFEGRVDEGEVGKLKIGMDLKISLGAIEEKEYEAKLTLIAPKGIEVAGAIQFKIEGDVFLDNEYVVRAGYSANATIITNVKKDILSVNESLLQFDNTTKKAFVEIQLSGQKFERRDIELGISDGVYAEVLGGVTEKDNIKIWNKTEPLKRGDVEEQEYKYDN